MLNIFMIFSPLYVVFALMKPLLYYIFNLICVLLNDVMSQFECNVLIFNVNVDQWSEKQPSLLDN